ncbi:TonB-dependent vitamin B12 receptor BtuB [Pantoea eucrina]|uniref:Vitamin B12 transporter BtuB n=1 Tax=Pantoea eucrina TaxID=472693 RepID=A0ABU5LAE0_9GAMM|nr:TonB-dependent vitamin B12 receptor BtuB [Pantoea eucrina]MDZ7276900.1 TonB-dependent vitamin B12 receptor BtuB [Pantoea eucrina]
MKKYAFSLFAFSATALSLWASFGYAQQQDDTQLVTANRFQQPVSSVLAPTVVVTRDEIDRWQAKSLLDVMRRLPGVDIAQNGGLGQASSVSLRGAEARHTLVLIDGIPLAKSGITGITDFSQIPLALIQRIDVIRGPRSAVYGADAIGGVVNIITEDDQPGGKIGASLGSDRYQEYDGALRQKIGEGTLVTVAGAYQSTQGYNIQPQSTYSVDRDRDGFRSKTFWAGVNHTFNDSLSAFFRGYGYANNTSYDAGYQDGGDKRQVYNHTYEGGLRFGEARYSSELTFSEQRYKDYNYASTLGLYQNGTSLDDMRQRNLQWGNSAALGNGSVSAGIDWQQQELTSSDRYSADSYSRINTGYYLTTQQRFNTLTLEGALRGDDNNQFGWNSTWQAAAGWEFIPNYRFILSYGTAFEAPTLGQMYGQSRLAVAANPNLQAEKSHQIETGMEGTTGPVDWHLYLYQNKINNLIDYQADENFVGTYYNVQSATIKGIEWSGSVDTGIFTHRITLQYLDPRRDQDNELLAHRSRQQYKYQLDWTWRDIDIDLAWQYFGKSVNNNSNQYTSVQRPMPSYSLVDVSAAYPVTSHLTVRGKIANLLDKDYETVYGYRTPGREYTLSASYSF